MAKPRNRLLDWLVYAAMRLVTMFFFMFSVRANYRTVDLAARVLCRLSRRHVERAREHLRPSFPDWDEARIDRVARQSLKSLLQFGMEMLFMPRLMTRHNWRSHVRLRNLDGVVHRLLRRQTGMILLTGHFGNFDVLGYTIAMLGFPSVAVFRPLDNPYINEYVMAVREKTGQSLLFKKGAVADMDEILEAKGTLSFIADQDAGRKGIFVDFFGRPASTYRSIALMAVTHSVPVVVGYGLRLDETFLFEIAVERVIEPAEWADRADPLAWLTQEFTTSLEGAIRRNPQQYWWVHRRWKHQPKQRVDSRE
jgi:KDO2-lipid IV(A) lauroyltransferase